MPIIDRSRIEDAQRQIEKFIPDRHMRKAFLHFLFDMILYANRIDHGNWNLNLDKAGKFLQFNTGQEYCLTISTQGTFLVCLKKPLREVIAGKSFEIEFRGYLSKKKRKTSQKLEEVPDCLAKVPDSVGCLIEHQHIIAYTPYFQHPVQQFIDVAMRETTILPKMKNAHSSGSIAYISQETQKQIPNPGYVIEGNVSQISQEKLVSQARSIKNRELRSALDRQQQQGGQNVRVITSVQSNLHICFGKPEIHMPELVLWSENGTAGEWTINRHAKRNDSALFYMKAPLSSFVAFGKVMTDAHYDENEQSNWKGYYMAEIGEITLLPLPISLKEFRTKLPEWGFLKMPRQSIIVPPEITIKIHSIIHEYHKSMTIVPEMGVLGQSIDYTLTKSNESQLFDEITTILETQILEETVKERLQFTRIGQERFRKALITYWKGCCAVTGCHETRILRASHIKPWRVCNNFERLDVFNGLLLLPNLDVAFDQGLITFDRQGTIMISPSFRKNASMLGITEDMKIRLDERHQTYLSYHRKLYKEKMV